MLLMITTSLTLMTFGSSLLLLLFACTKRPKKKKTGKAISEESTMPTTAKPQTITQVQLVPIPVMTPQAQGPMTTIPPPKDGQKQQPQPKQKQQATGPVNKVTSGTKLTTQQTKNQKKPDVKKPNAPPPETTTPAAQTMMIDRQPQQQQQPNAMQMPMTMPMPMQSPGGQTMFYYMTPQGLLVPVQLDNVFPSQQSVFQQVPADHLSMMQPSGTPPGGSDNTATASVIKTTTTISTDKKGGPAPSSSSNQKSMSKSPMTGVMTAVINAEQKPPADGGDIYDTPDYPKTTEDKEKTKTEEYYDNIPTTDA